LFAMVPYVFATWIYSELVNGDTETFIAALGVLLGIRLFFIIIETFSSVLAWRLYGKRFMVQKIMEMFRTNNFPMREYRQDDVGNYIARIQANEATSPEVKIASERLEFLFLTCENLGALAGARIYSAAEAALNAYSPKNSARE